MSCIQRDDGQRSHVSSVIAREKFHILRLIKKIVVEILRRKLSAIRYEKIFSEKIFRQFKLHETTIFKDQLQK